MPQVSNGINRRSKTNKGDREDKERRERIESNCQGELRNCGGEGAGHSFQRREAKEPKHDTGAGRDDGGNTTCETLRLGPPWQTDGQQYPGHISAEKKPQQIQHTIA